MPLQGMGHRFESYCGYAITQLDMGVMLNLRKRLVTFALSVAVVLTGLFVIQTTPAQAAQLRGGVFGPYTIRRADYGIKCMDITDVSYNNGAFVQIYDCLGSQQTNQLFYFWAVDGTSEDYQITPAHSWKCLDIWNVSQADYTRVQQWDCLGASQLNQVFTVHWAASFGGYTITPRHSGKPVNNWNTTNGSAVFQYGNYYTYWSLVPA